jgi:hypothetical protein
VGIATKKEAAVLVVGAQHSKPDMHLMFVRREMSCNITSSGKIPNEVEQEVRLRSLARVAHVARTFEVAYSRVPGTFTPQSVMTCNKRVIQNIERRYDGRSLQINPQSKYMLGV